MKSSWPLYTKWWIPARRGWMVGLVGAMVLMASPVFAQGPSFDIRVEREGLERLLLRLEPTRIESSLEGATADAAALATRLVTDLVYSGLLALETPLPEGVRPPQYVPNDWARDDGPNAILQLSLSGLRRDEMVWTVRLLVARERRQLLGKRYVVDLDAPGRQVHHAADAIVQELTGERGVAQTRILFSREVGDGRELYLVDYDGRNLRQITRNSSLNLLPRWSPSGDRICYTSYWRGRQRLLVLDGQSGESRKIAEFTGLNFGASWAPSGEELVVTLTRDGDPEVYRMDLDGSIRARLTFEPAIDCSAVFDPTGNQIAYTSDRNGVPQIYRMSKDGTDRLRLTWEGSYNDAAAWSPRRDRIAYVTRRQGRFHIAVIAPDGSDMTPVTLTRDGNNEDPAWAPDGRHIVVSSDRDGVRRLWVIDVDGGWARPLTTGDVDDNGPDWSSPPAATQ